MQALVTYRAFGTQATDLDLDFDGSTPPEVVTQVLLRCTGNVLPEDELWEWTVGDRIAGLLHVIAREGTDILPVVLRCPACEQAIELELSLPALLGAHRQAAPEPCVVSLNEMTIAVRRPTGRDQQTWQQQPFATPAEARTAMLRSLLLTDDWQDAPVPVTAADAIDAALQTHDPLVNVRIETPCPACSTEDVFEVDVQGAVLRHLWQTQRRLVDDVHRLALHYHWSERQILKLPAWRRARYLTLIDQTVTA